MTIRIDRIQVNRGGPLQSDFEFEPGDLNLIYGQNETGKTYVVESLIKFLFKTTGKAPVAAGLRDMEIGGRVIVSGLKDPEPFTRSGRKLEDHWEAGTGLPPNFSRLLVVRAGETHLAAAEQDGVGRSMLKDYLSGEGLLEKVADRISLTVQKAEVEYPQIKGSRAGELKGRESSISNLDVLQNLLEQVEQGYASGEGYSLRQQKHAVGVQLDTLHKAKLYHAGQLAGQIKELNRQQQDLPRERDLATLESDIKKFDSAQAEIESKTGKLDELEDTSADFAWAKQALEIYKEVASTAATNRPNSALLLLTLLSVIGTVAFGLLGLNTWLVVSAVLALGFAVSTHMGSKKALSTASQGAELKKLEDAYRDRFGSELTDKATLQAKFEELNKSQILAAPLKESIDLLSEQTRTLERSITATLKKWTGVEVTPQEWQDVIQDLTDKISDLEKDVGTLERKLSPLHVPEEEYLEDDPGGSWNAERFGDLTDECERIEEDLREEDRSLEDLKSRVSQETNLPNSDWEDLITELRARQGTAAEEYRQRTADILARIQVFAVVEQFRELENSRIAKGLKRPELTERLRALTGRYGSIRHDDEEGLILSTDKDEEYSLSSMSTGAREQVFLALRMGFASIAMEGETGFLILDDAFQHSDWDRRQRLVDQTLSFIESGWQVFYFTMDDHIRDLFEAAGGSLGTRFRNQRLG